MRVAVPDPSLVLLVGPSGCGKSTLARRHFRPTEVVSSDACRAMVADDEADQSATADAFALLHAIVDTRLARARLTVVDATNVQARSRRPLVALAHHHNLPAVALVLDLPVPLCAERNAARGAQGARVVPAEAVQRQVAQLHESLPTLAAEGFAAVHVLGAAAADALVIERVPLPPDRSGERGPFDVIGDVHGCADELFALLERLGYVRSAGGDGWRHPGGRRAVFVGDLVDRGPRIPDVLRAVMAACDAGDALCVPGNHDDKLLRRLHGRNVQVTHGLEQTLEQLAREDAALRGRVRDFIAALPSHLVLDGRGLVVAHAGLPARLQGRESPRVRSFALFGDTTGAVDEYGLPVRRDWAAEYHGAPLVVYGHTPVAEPRWMHRTVNVDTGCIFGGALTALRYPELQTVSVPAAREYVESRRPFLRTPSSSSASGSP